jgi:hypothetical protein
VSDQADRVSQSIERAHSASAPSRRCARCGYRLSDDGPYITAGTPSALLAAWALCLACYELLVQLVQTEISAGPGPAPEEAWTKARKMRAARERRWSKSDP